VVLHLEVELTRRAPAAHFDVAGLVLAHRHAFVRQVRHAEHQVGHAFLDVFELQRRGLHFVANAAHFRHHRRGVLAPPFHPANLLRQAVAASLQFFGTGLHGAAFRFECGESRHVEGIAAVGEAFRHAVEVFAQQLDVKHGVGAEVRCMSLGF
jgi:hypothetical protein